MFDKLASLFAPATDSRSVPDGRTALAAVLVRAAEADGSYDAAERDLVAHILAQRFGLGQAEARALADEGEALAAGTPDIVGFTRAIKDSVPHEERVAVIEAVWEIAYADGERSHEEAALVRKLCGLLYVADRDSGLARQRVEARLSGG
jgi:uncharacterized tellurite resistance protein B-like protein